MSDQEPTGRLEWIGLRPERRAPVVAVEEVEAVVQQGLVGDRFVGRAGGQGTRQVTLVQRDELALAGQRLGRDAVDPASLRRNLMLSGISLSELRDRRFRIGDQVVLETTGGCPPCDRMDETLGPGGRDALEGLGGITARVVQGGVLRSGDAVVVLSAESVSSDGRDPSARS